MCGIAGFINTSNFLNTESVLRKMIDSLKHRGPDSEGGWTNESSSVAFIHTRLAIQDLSEAGKQPMQSTSGRYVITYNGEIYNSTQLRKKLEQADYHFRGHSDTEVILAAIEEYGLETAIAKFIGMFAFALWDKKTEQLSLVRDRLGIKPLYYGWHNSAFVFGSEIKALCAIPGFKQDINRHALASYLRFNYIPTPYSIYTNIHKLKPGNILTIKYDDIHRKELKERQYWSVHEHYIEDPTITPQIAVEQTEKLLKDAIALRMLSDVPLGAFLSGGVDSSLVVALMQAQSNVPVKTFSIGFTEKGFNEATYAKEIAQHLGTNHTELYLSPQKALEVIPRLPELYDEPFADSSQIPTYLVSKLAREHVTVSLSGDGGDELFCGYHRHMWVSKSWDIMKYFPEWVRIAGAKTINSLSPYTYNKLFGAFDILLPKKYRFSSPGIKIQKLAKILNATGPEDMYRRLVSQWDYPEQVVMEAHEPPTIIDEQTQNSSINDISQRMMYLDTVSYLPDDILTKIDRASMAVGLEARVPLLDHRLVEYAARLPVSLKYRDNQSKWPLRQILSKYVPKHMIERPKMGFAVPLDHWFRTELRDWCESLLSEKRIRNEGFFHPEPIQKMWKEHLSGKRNWHLHLWSILMFQSWLDAQKTT